MAADDSDPSTWFPVGGGGGAATTTAVPSGKAAPSDDPTKWFPVGGQAETKAAPSDFDEGYGMMARPTGPTIEALARGDVRGALAPSPGTVYGDVLPLAMDEKTGAMRPALPNMVRNPLLGLAGGVTTGQNVMIDPRTNALSLSPEAASVVPFAASPLNVRAVPPEGVIAGGRQITGVNPLTPEIAARANVRAATAPPEVAAAGPAPSTPVPNAPTPIRPSPIPNGQQPGAAAPIAGAVPTTAAEAKAVANAKYAQADATGGTLTPQFTDRFLDNISQADKQTSAGRATTGSTELSQLLDRYNNGPDAIRGQPLSLQAAQEIDEGLGDLIDKHFDRVNGMDKEGNRLLDVQRTLRDQIDNAGPGDVSGSTAGFDALVDARQAWSQYRKMDDLERMKSRADGTQNPTSSFQTQVNNLVNNPSRSRGYTPEEIAAVKDAADRGVIGGALHVMGSRLLPHVAGAVGASIGGIPGFIAGEALAHFGGAAARNAANALQTQRFNQMMGVFGSRVPPQNLLTTSP